jgi:peptide/nickel transport system permease protein
MVPLSDRSRTRILIPLLRRLGLGIFTAFAALSLTFFILRLIGNDPVDSLLAQGLASPDQAELLRHRLGLDRPLFTQYLAYLSGLIRADFGKSLFTQRPVLQTIVEQFRWTIELAITGLALGVCLGFVLGITAAWRDEDALGFISASLASLLTALPVAFTGVLILWLGGLFGFSGARLFMPGSVLGLAMAGPVARLTFSSLRESLTSPYILAAEARGIRRSPRLLWHAMRPILPSLLSLIALEAAFLFAGTVVTETIFSRPGLGRLMVRAILEGDYPITQGLVTLAAMLYTASHTLADWLALVLDPRLQELT